MTGTLERGRQCVPDEVEPPPEAPASSSVMRDAGASFDASLMADAGAPCDAGAGCTDASFASDATTPRDGASE